MKGLGRHGSGRHLLSPLVLQDSPGPLRVRQGDFRDCESDVLPDHFPIPVSAPQSEMSDRHTRTRDYELERLEPKQQQQQKVNKQKGKVPLIVRNGTS